MTEKRFDFKYEYITLDEGVFATAKDKQNAELISRTLNQLSEENEKLKKSISEYAFISDCSVQVLNEEKDVKEDYLALSCKELHKLKKENEQLKSQFNYIQNSISEHIKHQKTE